VRIRLEQLERQQGQAANGTQPNFTAADVQEYIDGQLDGMISMMTGMKKNVNDLIADTHQDAIKFNGFGFWRVEEANACVEIHIPNHKFGLIVDAYMVFEQLSSATAKTIPTRQQLAKIDMKDLSQGVAVSSFDHQVPKLLYDCTGYVVVGKDESHFNQVKTFKDWDEPQTGFWDCLKLDMWEHSNWLI
jgi:hypothetical protein